jgi:hypothetical protein
MGGIIQVAALKVMAPLLIGWLSYLIAEGVDQFKRVTGKMPVAAKQAAVAVVASLLSALGAAISVTIIPDGVPLQQALDSLDTNAIAAALFAFALKHGTLLKKRGKLIG